MGWKAGIVDIAAPKVLCLQIDLHLAGSLTEGIGLPFNCS